MFNLQKTISILGVEYPLDTDFRNWIHFQQILINKKLTDDEKAASLIDFIEKLGLPFFQETLEGIMRFFIGDTKGKTEQETDSSNDDNKIHYCFEKDFEYIYSAFLEQYNIDLIEIEELHWYKFKALFKTLNDNCMFSKIIHYRSVDIQSIPKEQQDFYKKMKKMFALDEQPKRIKTTEEYHKSIIDKYNKQYKELIDWQTEQLK